MLARPAACPGEAAKPPPSSARASAKTRMRVQQAISREKYVIKNSCTQSYQQKQRPSAESVPLPARSAIPYPHPISVRPDPRSPYFHPASVRPDAAFSVRVPRLQILPTGMADSGNSCNAHVHLSPQIRSRRWRRLIPSPPSPVCRPVPGPPNPRWTDQLQTHSRWNPPRPGRHEWPAQDTLV